MSEAFPATARDSLRRALTISEGLATSGRLQPVDAWMVPDLRRRLESLPD